MSESDHIIKIKISPEAARQGAKEVKSLLAEIRAAENANAKVKKTNSEKSTTSSKNELEALKKKLEAVRKSRVEAEKLIDIHRKDSEAVKLLTTQVEKLNLAEKKLLGTRKQAIVTPKYNLVTIPDKKNLKKEIDEQLIDPFKKASKEISAAREEALKIAFGVTDSPKYNLVTIPDKKNLKKEIEEQLIDPFKKASNEISAAREQALKIAFGVTDSPKYNLVTVPDKKNLKKEIEEQLIDPYKKASGEIRAAREEALKIAFGATGTPDSLSTSSLMSKYGIMSPETVDRNIGELKRLRSEMVMMGKEGQNVTAGLESIDRQLRVLEYGSSRARSAFRKFFAGIASLTFELTGAIFGIGAALASLTFPLRSGLEFQSTLENMKVGMAGILMSMGQINDKAFTLGKALEVSKDLTKGLVADSLKYGVNIEALATTTRAVMASGFAGGMRLEEIREISTLGTLAVKTIGLDARQSVQEIRDLVAGGIQAASSTLATAIGVRDSDVKRWREAGTLFEELKTRLEGFGAAGIESTKTLTGAFDILQQKVQLLFVNEEAFEGLKRFVLDISEGIGKIDEQTGELKLNKNFLQTARAYTEALRVIGGALGEVIKFFGFLLEHTKELISLVAAGGVFKLAKHLLEVKTAAKAAGVAMEGAAAKTAILEAGLGGIKKFGSWVGKLGLAARGGLIGIALFGAFELFTQIPALNGLLDKIKNILGMKVAPDSAISAIKNATSVENLGAVKKQIQDDIKLLKEERATFSGSGASRRSDAMKRSQIDKEIAEKTKLLQQTETKLTEKTQDVIIKLGGNLVKLESQIAETAKDTPRMIKRRFMSELEELDNNFKTWQEKYSERIKNLKTKGIVSPTETVPVGSDAMKKQLEVLLKDQQEVITNYKEGRASIEKKMDDELYGEQRRRAKQEADKLSKLKLKFIKTEEEEAKKALKERGELLKEQLDEEQAARDRAGKALAKQREAEKKALELAEAQKLALDNVAESYDNQIRGQIERIQVERQMQGLTSEGIAQLQNEIELRRALIQLDRVYSRRALVEGTDLTKLKEAKEAAESAIRADFKAKQTATTEQFALNKNPVQGLIDGWREYRNTVNEASLNTKDMFKNSIQGMEEALFNFVKGSKGSFGDFVQTVIDGLIRIQIQKAITGFGSAIEESGAASSLMSLFSFGGFGSSSPAPTGGEIGMFNSFAFAKGGVTGHLNQIVSQPTMFANGAGLMGEAGSEAIMPLTRDKTGDLAVKAVGSGNGGNNIQISVTVNNDGSSNVRQNVNDEGARSMAEGIRQVVQDELLKQQRAGGTLSGRY